jgi:pyruvate,water dikinase
MSDDPMDWDPTHRASGPDAHWTTTNAGEAFPGVVTPLSWTFIADAAEATLRWPAHSVGALTARERRVPSGEEPRFIQAFYGRIAMQVDYFALLGDRLPGSTGREIVANTLGRVPDGMEFHPTRRRYPVVAVRLPWCFVTTQRRIRRLGAEMARWHADRLAAVTTQDLAGALATFLEARGQFERAAVLHGLVLFSVVQPLYAALTQLVDKAGVGDVATLSGAFGVETGEMITDLWDVSRGRLTVERVAAEHGFHGPLEGEMSSRVWREDDAPLRRMVAEYANRDDSEDPRRREQDRVAAQVDTTLLVLGALPGWQRPGARLLLRLAAAGIPLRGIGKVAFLQTIDVGRAAARRAGHLLAEQGALREVDDVFYLTVDELSGSPTVDIQGLVERRKSRRAGYLLLTIPPGWKGTPEPTRIGADARTLRPGDVVEGIGVSEGVVEGVARVVLDPDFMDVEPGEILIAPITDPSWSSIMFLSKALVVDLGGALSHAAIVARELGIPCVVNTENGTSVIRTGDHVRVDGEKGTVELLATAGGEPFGSMDG